MSETITRTELAMERGKFGATAVGWIQEANSPYEDWDHPTPAQMVAAFVAAFRERLDLIGASASSASGSILEARNVKASVRNLGRRKEIRDVEFSLSQHPKIDMGSGLPVRWLSELHIAKDVAI